MKDYNHLNVHQDHRVWESDLEMWILDLKMWNEEAEALNEDLSNIHEAVKNHRESLMDHSKILMAHQDKLKQHEKDITILIEGTSLDTKLLESHILEDKNHTIYRNAHERLKRYHHKLIALTNGLKKALESM